jgi:hypothetical protein
MCGGNKATTEGQDQRNTYRYWQHKADTVGDDYRGTLREYYLAKAAEAYNVAFNKGIDGDLYRGYVAETETRLLMQAGDSEEFAQITIQSGISLFGVSLGSIWAQSIARKASDGPSLGFTPEEASAVGTLRGAAKTRGNFSMGAGTHEEIMAMGEMWVGSGYRVAGGKNSETWISYDGLKQFRLPTWKPNVEQFQANFEWRSQPSGPWTGNGHMVLTTP